MNHHNLHIEYNPVQLVLPVNYTHIIDESDPVVSFQEVVGGLNLRRFINTSSKGRNDYDPKMMLELILFGFMENIRSLRQLEKACRVDVRFMYLAQGATPSFMAFQRFIDHKLTHAIDDIFYHINAFLIEKEKIDTDVLYVDGTKLEANANKYSFVWKKAILNYQKKLYLKISKTIKALDEQLGLKYACMEVYEPTYLDEIIHVLNQRIDDEAIVFVYGKGKHKHPLQRFIENFRAYQEKLTEYQNHLLICGERNSYSKTDHDATFMHGKEDYYNKSGILKPYYNLQIGVSEEYILHYGLYPNPTDTKTWMPFFENYALRYNGYPLYPVGDAGYGSYDNYMYNLKHGMNLSMKYNTFSKEDEPSFKKKLYHIKNMKVEGQCLISEDGHIYDYSHEYEEKRGHYPKIKQIYIHRDWDEAYEAAGVPYKISRDIVLLEMQAEAKRLLKSEKGIRLRIQRSIEAEGAFGEIKSNSEYTRIQRRSKEKVKTEICLVLIGYNLRKYHAKKHRLIH